MSNNSEIRLPRDFARSDGGVRSHSAEASRLAEDAADIDRLIGSEIANLRVRRAIAEADFSASLGLATQALRDLEAGRSRFDPQTLVRAARILRVNPSALFRDVAEKFALDLLADSLAVAGSSERSTQEEELRAKLFRVVSECDEMISRLEAMAINWPH